ncbi:hypothetical protein [Streptomyces flavofungini]|uniref:hypothetical protein n=1 Tax=Streptomyces flavofungini TaxID=68200 RepID=UPI0025B1B294|nr:hypothetical protein [Streptomyces flavofungini]WJV51623.1 hypothetical protein QUY26_00100 [Streptomyces flavofungini]
MPLRALQLAVSARETPSLPAYDPWARVDLHRYRDRHGPLVRGRLGVRLALPDEDLTRCRAGVSVLAHTPGLTGRP